MIKLKDILNEAMSDAEIKKMHQKYKDTGELPPHLKKMLKGKKDFEKKFKVKNIVVPGLEWMADIDESVNEAPDHDMFKALNKVNNDVFRIMNKYDGKADMDAVFRSWMLGLHAKLKKAGVKL